MRKLILLLLLLLCVPFVNGCIPLLIGGAIAGGATLMVTDRRTTRTQADDQNIEFTVLKAINDRYRDSSHISVTSYNGVLLLTGEAANANIRSDAEAIARSISGVRNVFNEILVAGNSSLASRSNDGFITSKVKTRFLDNGRRFAPNHVKVVTENGVVYLMGLVTKSEAEAASEIASTTRGVERVVRVFEYLP